MPDANGNFKGHGWSRKYADAWERVFDPKKLPQTPEEKSANIMKMVAQMKP
jgi:hypothetical protein